MLLTLTVNGRLQELDVDPDETLLDVIRERLHLLGTKEGCLEGECGACTVLIDGGPIDSCIVAALAVDGADGDDHRRRRVSRRRPLPVTGGDAASRRSAVRVLHTRVS